MAVKWGRLKVWNFQEILGEHKHQQLKERIPKLELIDIKASKERVDVNSKNINNQ